MNKKLLVGGLSLAVIGISSLVFISKPTYQEIKINDLESEKIALYVKNETGNYEKTNTIPTSGYILNEEKSRCNNNAKPSWNKATNSLKIKDLSNDNTSCYLYFDKAPTSEDTLAKLNITNVNTTTPDFSQVATTDEGIYAIEDGMYGGTSYYWRGATTTNYVKFANFCWRIVRINGDGTIRLIYDGATCHENGTNTAESIAVTSVAYNSSYDRSEYVGYTYSVGSQRPSDNATGTASNLKIQTESWFNTNITGTNADKVADGKFCNDRETASSYTWESQSTSEFLYAAAGRLETVKTPELTCLDEDIYSLKAGAITADEVAFGGGVYSSTTTLNNNQKYYLYNGQKYWTMTPSGWIGAHFASDFHVAEEGYFSNGYVYFSVIGVRPVINLKSDTLFIDGDGTLDNPYVVEGA